MIFIDDIQLQFIRLESYGKAFQICKSIL